MKHSAEYDLFIHSWEWQMIKIRKLKAVGHACEDCGANFGLQVHHFRYRDKYGRSILGREKDSDLLVVCRECHRRRHGLPSLSE